MGCISSKAIARSMSIREELNNGLHNRSAAWEDLLTSHSGNDHLFAFVCSTNSMTKLRSSSFTLPSTDDPQTPLQTRYLSNAWDLIPDISGKTEAGESAPDYIRFTRSKSCQTIREKEMLSETDGINENKLDSKDRNQIGSRSFHTVEEYDALLERIHKFTRKESFQDHYPWENLEKPKQDSNSMINSSNFENVVRVDEMHETGWKRKAVAKGLKSLDMSTIEFPAIGRLRQRVHAEGQVYSPGSYITPKFGSYNGKMAPAVKEKEGGESSLFSPELVAAFEDCVQQLQEEEASILSHMDEYPPLDDEMEDGVEEVPSDMQIDALMTN